MRKMWLIKDKLKKKILEHLKIEKPTVEISNPTLDRENFLPISKTYDNDIFIAGYPKSGNTWMQNLISGILFGIDTAYLPDRLTQELVPDVHVKKYYKRFSEITFFKTHQKPQPHMKRVIHLVRDGRDVMCSYFAMNKGLNFGFSLEEMVLEEKGLFLSTWQEHTREWIENPYKAEILVVKYEDLVRNTEKEIKKILMFAQINRPDETIKSSITGNSFSQMVRKEKEFGWDPNQTRPSSNFIRRGKIGSYLEEMPTVLVNYFENRARKELKYFGYL